MCILQALSRYAARLRFASDAAGTTGQFLPNKTYFGRAEDFSEIWLPEADVSANADNVAEVAKHDKEYFTLPIGTWGVEVVIAGNYNLVNTVLGLIAVKENQDDIVLYRPGVVQSEGGTNLLTSSDVQYGVVAFREDLVESDGTTQMYLVMAGLTTTVVTTILLKGYIRLTDRR